MKYWYCGVKVKGIFTTYSYISDEGKLPVGAYVVVPFGSDNELRIGIVESSDQYDEDNAPFPVERTKRIIRLATASEYENAESLTKALKSIAYADAMIDAEDWDAVMEWAEHHHESTEPLIIEKLIDCYKHCIEQNNIAAALNLGTLYYTGRGVKQDYKEAFRLYKIAADAGELRAICNCGYCYYYGRHTDVDYNEAYRYFSLGALLFHDANCLYKLGDMYLYGFGVEKRESYAYLLFQQAKAAVDYSDDCKGDIKLRLGMCNLYGIGTTVDVKEGHELLCEALVLFYERRKTDPFVKTAIIRTKELLREAEAYLDSEILSTDN